jgi:hypothetical protein
MTTIFARLLIVHLLGDFILFRNRRLKKRGEPLWRSGRLLSHSLIHFILAWIALWEFKYWGAAVLIGISHYLSEVVIRQLLRRRPQFAFVLDQIFHVGLLFIIEMGILTPFRRPHFEIPWLEICGLIAVTFPAAKFIEVFLAQWPPAKSAGKIQGLINAGLWIGILERILIYVLILTGHWEGIGFLLTAKSVFRFGDLTNSKDISLTEYIMVGTLLSFCLAIAAGLITTYLAS